MNNGVSGFIKSNESDLKRRTISLMKEFNVSGDLTVITERLTGLDVKTDLLMQVPAGRRDTKWSF